MNKKGILVKVKAAPEVGIFGMETPTAIGAVLGILIMVLITILLLRRRESDIVVVKTQKYDDVGWSENPVSATPPASEPVAVATAETAEIQNSGPPIPASGLPTGWTMEQWSYYGEQYLASLEIQPQAPPNPMESYPPAMSTPQYQNQPVMQSFDDVTPASNITNIEQTQQNDARIQEPAPTRASQQLSDLLDDLDI